MRDIPELTPAHIASENAHTLRALLSLDPHGIAEDLRDRQNKDGITLLGYRKLERFANDLGFGGVRLGVGIGNSDVVWGPYSDREEEEGMDVDEYDDSDSD